MGKVGAKRSCRIAIYIDGNIDIDSEKLAEIKKWIVANLLRMKQVLPAFIEKAISNVAAKASTQV
jgi:hypothetical protein